jgi:glycosyltransferase involved in cell wall biosynthesis
VYIRGEKTLRVVYVGSPPLFSRGASAIHVMKMCHAMAKLGIDVELVLPSYNNKADIFEYYGVEPNFKLITFPSLKNSSARHIGHGILSSIYTKINRKNFDLVLTRNIFYTYLSTRFFNIPTIYDAHHPLVKAAHFLFNSFKDSKHLIRFSTNSKGLADIYLKLGLPEDKLIVAPNGVDLEKFEGVPSKEEARKELNLPIDKKIVCYSGNTYSGRGIELLIEASLRLRDALFLIVGGLENDIENYKKIAQEKRAENLKLVGFISHKKVPLYISSADVLVMPYTSRMTIKGGSTAAEFTSPIKLFEYMASRRPIVATSLPSIKEILKDGSNALLVGPDDVDLLVKGIKRVLEDHALAEKLAAQAGSDVKKYTWEKRVKRILNGL